MGLNDCVLVRIAAKGKALDFPLGTYVLQFQFEDCEKGDDILKMVFADPFKTLADSVQFTENTEWTVQWGFPGAMYPARKVLLKKPTIRHGELEIMAHDKGSSLKVTDRHDVVEKKTYKEMIEDIGKRNGLKTVVDPNLTDVVDFFAYGGRSDYNVLEYFRSRCEDHFFKIIADTLHFERRDRSAAPVAAFNYGRNSRLLEYEITVKDQANAKNGTQAGLTWIDPKSFRSSVSTADESNSPSSNLGNRRAHSQYSPPFLSNLSNQAANGGARPLPGGTANQRSWTGKALPSPPVSKKQADQIVRSARSEALDGSVEAKFKILAEPGDPFYKVGDIISVGGIGKKFSGAYRITKITHDLNKGFIYDIEAKRNALNAVGDGALPFLNGPVNVRLSIPNIVSSIAQPILGSVTGRPYGTAGRLL